MHPLAIALFIVGSVFIISTLLIILGEKLFDGHPFFYFVAWGTIAIVAGAVIALTQ